MHEMKYTCIATRIVPRSRRSEVICWPRHGHVGGAKLEWVANDLAVRCSGVVMPAVGKCVLACVALAFALLDCDAACADDPCARTDLKAVVVPRTQTVQLKWVGQISNPMHDRIAAQFNEAKARVRSVVLILSSCGGSLGEAEKVIDTLREIKKTHHLETRGDPGSTCASACIPIFLQGTRRRAALTSSWLFHEVTRRSALDKTKKRVDRARTERVFSDYYAEAGVSEAWLNQFGSWFSNRTIGRPDKICGIVRVASSPIRSTITCRAEPSSASIERPRSASPGRQHE